METDRCVGGESDCEITSNVEVVDLDGKYVTPGLIDAHVHFFQSGFFTAGPMRWTSLVGIHFLRLQPIKN